MKKALVIHPMMSFYAGGEYLCMNVCQALQEEGYKVTLATDEFRPSEIERFYQLATVIEKCDYIHVPQFRPRFSRLMVLQRLFFGQQMWGMFRGTDADVVFSTQSSPFVVPKTVYHFVYNAAELYHYPLGSAPPQLDIYSKHVRRLPSIAFRLAKKLLWKKRPLSDDWFFAVGSIILNDLKQKGYPNSSLVFPPCRVTFKPKFPKKKQVVQAVRLVPEKRLELFFDIARNLPDYPFYLLARDSEILRRLAPGYAERVLSNVPRNVTVVNSTVRERPDLLEESKVYLYTGREPGIGLSLVESLAAGCTPFSSSEVGAVDIIRQSGVGHLYSTAQEAASKMKICLEENLTQEQVLNISLKANEFSPEKFRQWVGRVIQSQPFNS